MLEPAAASQYNLLSLATDGNQRSNKRLGSWVVGTLGLAVVGLARFGVRLSVMMLYCCVVPSSEVLAVLTCLTLLTLDLLSFLVS